jgi:hypothetical protein
MILISSTVAVALWALEEGAGVSPSLKLTVDGAYEGFVGGLQVNNPQWSPEQRS